MSYRSDQIAKSMLAVFTLMGLLMLGVHTGCAPDTAATADEQQFFEVVGSQWISGERIFLLRDKETGQEWWNKYNTALAERKKQ